MAISKSGHPDRRGFNTYIYASLFLTGSAAITPFFLHWGIALAQFLVGAIFFIATEAISAPPANEARAYQRFRRHNLSSSRSPVLVCLGDSLTHGTASHSYTVDIPTQLASTLAMQPPRSTSIFADPLWVVNCGQNYITTHTIWRERLNKALDCHPDYILVLIGTNDVRAMYKKSWGAEVKRINDLPEIPTLATFTRNFHGILSHIQQASPMTQVGVCTLPPLGENVKSNANKLVRQVNDVIIQAAEQAGDKFTIIPLFDRFETILEKEGKRTDLLSISPLLVASMSVTYQLVPGMIKRNTLGKMVGHKLLFDGIHLNERASAELVDLIVEWLVTKGIAKAIAVKS